ncbi:hypothetical protein [Solimicrobium silvestre]|uniref:Uncharacterized protein n=1 Tax=Solimicrobium silvestre TaxID=2099400 RepID=A0A2S9GTI2_9BURK|nr:hypothetical protein [Solimicrobium silvestre]PRC90998.1 hypothetical protein S2091_4294 [Solimicrobium silvestre]
MSFVSAISASQPSFVSSTAQSDGQQIPASQPQSSGGASSVAISAAGQTYLNYEQTMAIDQQNQSRTIASADSDPQWGAGLASAMAHDTSMDGSAVGGLVSISAPFGDPVTYTNGAPVTVASQAYFTKQYASYQNQVTQLYNSDSAKGTPPGQIISDIFALQAKQPDAFRAMMSWPPGSGPLSVQQATNVPGSVPQYLNAGGQVIQS